MFGSLVMTTGPKLDADREWALFVAKSRENGKVVPVGFLITTAAGRARRCGFPGGSNSEGPPRSRRVVEPSEDRLP